MTNMTKKVKSLKSIPPADLIAMDAFTGDYPIRIDLAYASDDNFLLGQAVYKPEAKLWLHKDLAHVVLNASKICEALHGYHMVLYDGLRTADAQTLMLQSERVQANPEWLEEPRLLSPPGCGAHPRGMAIDVSLCTVDGVLLDMGTPFDFLAQNSSAQHNPAHRHYVGLQDDHAQNRRVLDHAMSEGARHSNIDLVPLPQEWWDFRLPKILYEQ